MVEQKNEQRKVRFLDLKEPTQTVASVVPVRVAERIAERAKAEGRKPSAVMRDVLVREFSEAEPSVA